MRLSVDRMSVNRLFFNRIAGERISIVEDTPGVTRDRIYTTGEWLLGVNLVLLIQVGLI